MYVRDRNLLARLRHCTVVGEYRRLLSLHSVPAHCGCCSDIPGDGPDLPGRRLGGRHSSPEATSPKARFATDSSCWTDFRQPVYRVSQDPQSLCGAPAALWAPRVAHVCKTSSTFSIN